MIAGEELVDSRFAARVVPQCPTTPATLAKPRLWRHETGARQRPVRSI